MLSWRPIEPLSEFKFRNIMRQTYDYSCGSAALTTADLHETPDKERD